jgi:hypothetical protein
MPSETGKFCECLVFYLQITKLIGQKTGEITHLKGENQNLNHKETFISGSNIWEKKVHYSGIILKYVNNVTLFRKNVIGIQ